MSLKDDIKILQAALIPDNTANEISPEDVRDALALTLDNLSNLGSNYYGAIVPSSAAIASVAEGATVLPLENGTYANFNGLTRTSELCVFVYNGSEWNKKVYGGLIDPAKNKFDKSARIDETVLTTIGDTVSDVDFYTTDYIPVIVGNTYVRTDGGFARWSLYDENKDQLINIDQEVNVYLIPSNGAYIRASCRYTNVDPDDYQLEIGSVETGYQKYGLIINNSLYGTPNEEDGFAPLGSDLKMIDSEKKLSFMGKTVNLYNIKDTDFGYYDTGAGIIADPDFNVSRFIAINENTEYTRSYLTAKVIAFYDSAKVFISNTTSGATITSPSGAAFCKVSYRPSETPAETFMFIEGNSIPDIYYPFGYTVDQDVSIHFDTLKKPLKMGSLGDSITYGFIPHNDPNYPGQLQSYARIAASNLGLDFVNYGISGTRLGQNPSNDPLAMCVRYVDMDDDLDIITVMGGTNDIRQNVPLGVMTDRITTTFYGALHVLCEGLIKKYRHDQGLEIGKKKVIVFLNMVKNGFDLDEVYYGSTFGEFSNAIEEVCAYYSIPVFDSYNRSGINPHILRTFQGTETGYLDLYNPYITDGTHPNQDGQVMFGNAFTDFLRNLIID